MRRVWVLVAAVAATAALAAGDVVYLQGGKMLRGKVTREGDTVIVAGEAGETKVSAAEVVHIVFTGDPPRAESRPAGGDARTGEGGEAEEPTAPRLVPASAEGVVNPGAPEKSFVAEQAVVPEAVIYSLERIMARTSAGNTSFYLRQEVERARSSAHDRKRRGGADWLSPRDFPARRTTYAKRVAEAEDLFARAGRLESSKTEKDVTMRRGLLGTGHRKNREAADGWGDPLLRKYLMGLAAMYAGDLDTAGPLLRTCAKEAPLVAGFQQAYGTVLVEQKKGLVALEPLIALMRLRPEPRSTEKQAIVDLVEKGLRQVPGFRAHTPVVQTATDMLNKLKQAKSTYGFGGTMSARKGEPVLLMPDPKQRPWQTKAMALPVPPYDRLTFRQSVGVPAAADALLVDAKAARDAMEIFVQIDSNTIVPAQFDKPRSGDPVDPALTLVRVKGYYFTPLTLAEELPAAKNSPVLLFATDFLSEMGNRIRTFKGKVVTINKEGKPEFTVGPSAGEGACPLLVGDGVLAGYLTGRLDVSVDQCGQSKLIAPAELDYLFKAARNERVSSYIRKSTAATPPPPPPKGIEVKGRAFLVYFIASELLEP